MAGGSAKRDPAAGDLLAADASRTEAREGQKQQTEQFGVKGRREESRRPLEVHQDLIDEGRIPTYGRNPRIGVPVKMNEREQQAERPHELLTLARPRRSSSCCMVFRVYVRPSNGKSCGICRCGRPGPGMAGSYLFDRIAALRSITA